MPQFVMNGNPISSYDRFREHFSPGELLRQRETAAGFLFMHFRFIDDICRYHAEMFYLHTFADSDTQTLLAQYGEKGYSQNYVVLNCLEKPVKIRKALLAEYFRQAEQLLLMGQLWTLAQQCRDLSEAEKNSLFCLLVAGYSLAGKGFYDCPISADEAEDCFLRRKKEVEEPLWLSFKTHGDIELVAREKPFKVLMRPEENKHLKPGETIRQRKITALEDKRRGEVFPLTLELYKTEDDPAPQLLTIPIGDYIYANFVGSSPVFFHKAAAETEHCRLQRRGRKVIYTNKHSGEQQILYKSDFEPRGFVPEQSEAGWLLLWEDGVDIAFYSRRHDYIHTSNIVQAKFIGEECLLLDKYGTVYSNTGRKYAQAISCL